MSKCITIPLGRVFINDLVSNHFRYKSNKDFIDRKQNEHLIEETLKTAKPIFYPDGKITFKTESFCVVIVMMKASKTNFSVLTYYPINNNEKR